MALTLVEAAKYAANGGRVVESGYIEEFARTSDLMQTLPFKNISGNAYSYSREDTLPLGIGFRGVNESYTEGTGIINPQTESLRIYGGELKVDKFIVDTLGSQERSIQEAMKIKAMSLALTSELIKGDSSADPRKMDGLQVRVTGTQLINAGVANGGNALSLAMLDDLIDRVDGEPSLAGMGNNGGLSSGGTYLIMNKKMRNRLTQASRSTTLAGFITYGEDSFGRKRTNYAGIPILIVDYDNLGEQILKFDEANPVGGGTPASTSIYAVNFGESGVVGLQNGGMTSRDLGELQTQPAYVTRIEWYLGLAVMHGRSIARLQGIKDDVVVA